MLPNLARARREAESDLMFAMYLQAAVAYQQQVDPKLSAFEQRWRAACCFEAAFKRGWVDC